MWPTRGGRLDTALCGAAVRVHGPIRLESGTSLGIWFILSIAVEVPHLQASGSILLRSRLPFFVFTFHGGLLWMMQQ
eukprot:SAG11_NODE_4528_length_1863_cov_4.993764_2_plen_77_part_00